MLDNIDIAILTRVNELAARHGLKPYDFVAVARSEENAAGDSRFVLDFETPASGNALREERYASMLRDLGVITGDEAVLSGSYQHIIDSLDKALEIAPRARGRF